MQMEHANGVKGHIAMDTKTNFEVGRARKLQNFEAQEKFVKHAER